MTWLEEMKLSRWMHAQEGRSLWSWPFLVAWYDLKHATLRAICFVRGHDLHDDGYAGPESGCTDVNCHRCGWSAGRQWLY